MTSLLIELDPSLAPQVPEKNDPFLWLLSRANKLDEKRIVHKDLKPDMGHINYLSYLEICWANHLTPVFTPDILWFIILNELTSLVRNNPEKVRHLFSYNKDKVEIIVPTSSPIVLPIGLIIERLKSLVPSGVDRYTPDFTTTTTSAKLAQYAAFCDMVSPYYNYGMLMCGFPSIRVDGEYEDYTKVLTTFQGLPNDLKGLNPEWSARVEGLLIGICVGYETADPTFWHGIFSSKRCGSGHQTQVNGWLTKLYVKQKPSIAYADNYPSTAAKVDYRLLDTNQTYSMFQGLFSSELKGTILEPSFGTVIFETT